MSHADDPAARPPADPLLQGGQIRITNPLGMTAGKYREFCAVLELDTPAKVRAVETAASVARQYLAPFVIKAATDMLGSLYTMVEANTRARVIYLGGDGYSFGDVISELDPIFHNRYCAELHISRTTADAALEEAAPWGTRGADGFRKPGPHRDEPSSVWSDLVHYAEDSNLYLDRDGGEFALVDTGFKGSVQEMLTAAYPDAIFHGHYLFFCATADDRHADRKRGYALHLPQPNPFDGRAIREEFVDDPTLTFAHHDAIVAIEDLTRGPDVSPRRLDGTTLARLSAEDNSATGINPARIAPCYADPYVRQAVLAAISHTISTAARNIRQARTDRPGTWYAGLTAQAEALRPQLHRWLAGRPGDPALIQLLNSFVRRADKDRWLTERPAPSASAARTRSTSTAPRTPPTVRPSESATRPPPYRAPRRGQGR
ncbi:hypothetical protein PV379_10745 [Streptomyces caniscabiei]|uniref:hypothetical protein n=1 Tax=Streptomyces caniscabiei TaxID=2746961 RepID=UPI0029ADA695|nr:hypothetical protein [Streptomyces caniscabiei]MDX2601935.1 hypothetical protein [Streptomyces caniscabiei]MDX2737370.1 hypothetical protein [Streptomyces caniscabiei]MDX2777787.1 hypothetical protein [Streptomyces caniscabiei]